MHFVDQTASDSPGFIARVEAVVARAIHGRPAEVYLVRIDNWFGERWVGFGGKVLGAAGVHFRDAHVLPPFVPSRVVRQVCYRYSAQQQQYLPEECAEPLHIKQTSSDNLRRVVSTLLPNAALIWFSDRSAETGRGSVMAYVPARPDHEAWYASFRADREWAADRLIGITQTELEMVAETADAR